MYKIFGLVLFSFIFSYTNKFQVLSKEDNTTILKYDVDDLSIQLVDGKRHIIDQSQNLLDIDHFPVQSTFFQIQDNKDISVSYVVNESHVETGINIDSNIRQKSRGSFYPENNLVISDAMIFRGVVVKQITFHPYRINLQTGDIEIYNDVDFLIEEHDVDNTRNYQPVKLSKMFEPLYSSLISNYEPSSREEDYQTPAVLYIGGGSSLDNPYVQDLIDWRHKTGFIVYTVSTSDIGSSTSSIKNYIQNLYENSQNPPEIVGLIGDTGGSYAIDYFTESWSGYSGPGDFPYSQLDGNDLFPEVFIGRISVNSSSDLANVINKTLVYEKATYLNQIGDEWYERGALCGDPTSSGQSTIITNEYIANILNAYGFEDVNGNYGAGNYANWMENELEDGSLYMNYRGFMGTSGFGSSNINSASNGYKNPFAVFITCGTGSYNSTCLSEEFFRAGSVSNPKGAVASVGTATSGTHTLFNNIVNMGIYDGIFPKNLQYAGAAMANGRLSLLQTYPDDPNNWVSIFSYWNNLIGDPALRLWTDTPKNMFVDFDSIITEGENFIDVLVTNEDGLPVNNASITLLKGNDEIFKTVLTDVTGNASIDLEYVAFGEVHLTVTKQNYKPIESSFQIVQSANNANVSFDNISIDDSVGELTTGNNDGILNPGERVIVNIPIENLGSNNLQNLQGTLISHNQDDLVSIVSSLNNYGSVSPGEISFGNNSYVIELNPSFTQIDDLDLRLSISDGENEWSSLVNLNLNAGFLVFDSFELINGSQLSPGEDAYLKVYLKNEGNFLLEDVQLDLLPSGQLVNIIEGTTFLGDINYGEVSGSSNLSSLLVSINENTINGSVINVNSNVTSSNGYNQELIFNMNIGNVVQTDPTGPDEHGYYIYDSGDLGYTLAPFYDWIEIDSDFGGSGIELNMSDGGDGNNISSSSRVVDLPFPFTFYGITYNQITVSTNGWIAFGESELESFRNYHIPGAGGPSPMLAAFWDDMTTSSNAEIYKFTGEDYFIIQWSEMRTHNANDIETFQVILYDDIVLTPTGDNEIKIQYKTFNNTSQGNYSGWGSIHGGYSTIGIENHMADVGLQYTFNNEYPVSAMPLSNESAIFITTRTAIATLMGDSNQDGEINVLDIVVVVNHIINLESMDSMGQFMSDVDGNGIINILDIIQIINLVLDSSN